MFKAFYIWYYYLEELELPIDIIINYKNPKYFLTTKNPLLLSKMVEIPLLVQSHYLFLLKMSRI